MEPDAWQLAWRRASDVSAPVASSLETSLPALSLDELQPATAASAHTSKVIVAEPLRGLIDAGDVEGIEALGDVSFRQPYDDFRTPTLLHRALDLGHERLCAHMLHRGGEVLARTPGLHSATLAHVAARRGNVEALCTILRFAPEFLYAEDELGWTPLHDAAMEGRLAVAEYLIWRGADVAHLDRMTRDGQRPEDLAEQSEAAGGAAVAAYLRSVRAAGGIRALVREARLPFVKLRWLINKSRARPVFCVEAESLAFAAFLLEGDAEPRRPGLPEGPFRGVMLFLY
jgi:hypothetical protein